MDRKTRRPIPTLALLAAAALTFLLLQAIEFVVPVGNSMAPLIGRNDLVVLHDAPAYEIGDVVAYKHPEIGVVLHRIIDETEAGFVLQGDNNDFIDGHHPSPDEIVGKMWFHLPLVGPFLRWIPVAFLALAVLLRFAFPGRDPDETTARDRRSRVSAVRDSVTLPGGFDPRLAFLTVALTAAAVFLVAATLPTYRKGNRDVEFMHDVGLAYSATGPTSVYPTGTLGTGDPVFLSLIDWLKFEMTYDIAAERPVAITEAEASIRVDVTTPDGLTYTFPMVDDLAIDPDDTVRGKLSLRQLTKVINDATAESGVSYSVYDVDVVGTVNLLGATIQEQEITGSPTVVYPMKYDGKVLRAELEVDGTEPATHLMQPDSVALPDNRQATVPLLVARPTVSSLRTWAGALLVISALGAVVFRRRDVPARRETDLERMLRPHHDLILPVDSIDSPADVSTISVAEFSDLVEVAEAAGEFILQRTGEHHRVFAVLHGSVRYVYIWTSVTAPDDLDDLNHPPAQPAHASDAAPTAP